MSPFLSDCPSLMLGIAIHCIQHSQAMLERGVCELAHSFFHFISVTSVKCENCHEVLFSTSKKDVPKEKLMEPAEVIH